MLFKDANNVLLSKNNIIIYPDMKTALHYLLTYVEMGHFGS